MELQRQLEIIEKDNEEIRRENTLFESFLIRHEMARQDEDEEAAQKRLKKEKR